VLPNHDNAVPAAATMHWASLPWRPRGRADLTSVHDLCGTVLPTSFNNLTQVACHTVDTVCGDWSMLCMRGRLVKVLVLCQEVGVSAV
jgi:hypothetical protein